MCANGFWLHYSSAQLRGIFVVHRLLTEGDMQGARWMVGLWVISCGVLLSGACSSDEGSDPSDGHAGSGGNSDNGGAGGASAGGSHAGQGGERQAGCLEHATCGNWGPNFIDCPTSIDDLRAVCEFAQLESYDSSCGGTYLEASNGVQTQHWTFDADGMLIGAYSSGDVGDCDYWGTRCEPVGTAEMLCDTECLQHATCGNWGPNFIDCPTSIDDLRAVCEFAPLESYDSSCGGTYLEASNGVQTQHWTFDAGGMLIGAYSSGDVGDCDYWGTRCEPVGSAEILCGAGGQDSGGSGGESAAGAGGQGGAGDLTHGGVGGQGGIN
jgi:hypothetical protein